jgi:hypothetical protein
MCECVCDWEELMRRYVVCRCVYLEKVGFFSAYSVERYCHVWLTVSCVHGYVSVYAIDWHRNGRT